MIINLNVLRNLWLHAVLLLISNGVAGPTACANKPSIPPEASTSTPTYAFKHLEGLREIESRDTLFFYEVNLCF